MQLVDANAVFDVPPEVAVCPYCGGRLKVVMHFWNDKDDPFTMPLACERWDFTRTAKDLYGSLAGHVGPCWPVLRIEVFDWLSKNCVIRPLTTAVKEAGG